MMKKILLVSILTCLYGFSAYAVGKPYMISVLGEYGYNRTWEHHGGGELRAFMPWNEHVEGELSFEGLSSNVYTLSGTVRPKFPVRVGELFFDASVLYSAIQRNGMHDFVGAMSLGYRMDYVSLQVGCYARAMAAYERTWNSEDEYMCEPFNLLYRFAVNVRPLCERWNLFMGMANYDETQYERMWQPLFFMKMQYDFHPSSNFEYEYNPASHFRLLAEVTCKPTGMFHLDASFYGIEAKVGFAYKF